MITVNRKALVKALEFVSQTLPIKRSLIPLMYQVKVKVEGNNMNLETTDLTVTCKTNITVDSDTVIEVCIPCRDFLKGVKLSKAEDLTLEYSGKFQVSDSAGILYKTTPEILINEWPVIEYHIPDILIDHIELQRHPSFTQRIRRLDKRPPDISVFDKPIVIGNPAHM